uniref:Response regulator n=1 Tax=Desertifilum tharense IPPAS B-1220 TaxID=1781255 RepID=A0ACD5GRX3_9CYAN
MEATSATQAPLILMAEDNEANISTIVEYLEVKGYRVAIAMTGKEAVQLATQLRPHLILMDIQMPEMDGLEATRQIRTERSLAQIPIIALTSLVMPGDEEKCLEAGVNEYLAKPVSLKKLVNAIADYLKPINAVL